MSVQHQVVWPYATVKVIDAATGQPTIRGFAEGAILPPNAEPGDVRRLVGKGALAVLGATAPEPEPPVQAPVDPPTADGRPKDYASKPEWVDYAVARRDEGVSEDDARAAAEAKSKADLITEYGS